MSRQQRYDRQIRFPAIGKAGQQRLSAATVAILGCGALGSVAAEILARAGVGRLTLIDRDTVEWSNLQRQSLYTEADAHVGRAKADAAAERLRRINSDIDIQPHVVDVTAETIGSMLSGTSLVIDGSDNFGIRFLLNDYSLETRLPWVHGGCVGATGQATFLTGRGQPCFRCLIPEPPPAAAQQTCDTVGVVGAATHLVASLQAMLAIRFLSAMPDARDVGNNGPDDNGEVDNSTSGQFHGVDSAVYSMDLWGGRFRRYEIASMHCKACQQGKRDFLHGNAAAAGDQSTVLCGRNAVQIAASGTKIDLERVGRQWSELGRVDQNAFFVRLHLAAEATGSEVVTESRTLTLFRDGRAVIAGTDDLSVARSLYARYVGG